MAKTKSSTKRSAKTKAAVKAKPKIKAKTKRSSTAKKGGVVAKKKPAAAKKKNPAKKAPAKNVPAKKAAAKKPAAKKAAASSAKKRVVKRKPGVKALPKEFFFGLSDAIREAVAPFVRSGKGREIVGQAVTGDATFQIDRVAEKALLAYLRNAKEAVAYYSEDAGYTTFSSGQPQHLLVVDPIDGTRAAKCGFESCVIAIASTSVIERPTMADVEMACVTELVGPRTFFAERGKGARLRIDGHWRKPRITENTDLESVAWSMTVPARPAELIFPTAAKLVDLTSLKGGFFACNSTSFSLTRLLTGQLDACVDFANRYLRDIPDAVRDHFINAGRGTVLGIAPYDLAASLLIAEEAGCVVTDAYGEGFDDVLLLDSSESNQRSLIAAGNKELHGVLMSFFDARIRQFEELLKRRAG
jgi:myo-inositol-1(or 4)-monophosphatase